MKRKKQNAECRRHLASMNLDWLIFLSRFQMFRFPESCMAMQEDALGASLMVGRQIIQHYLLTNSEKTGSVLEKQDGDPSEMPGFPGGEW